MVVDVTAPTTKLFTLPLFNNVKHLIALHCVIIQSRTVPFLLHIFVTSNVNTIRSVAS